MNTSPKVTDPTDTGQLTWTLVLKVTAPTDTGQYTCALVLKVTVPTDTGQYTSALVLKVTDPTDTGQPAWTLFLKVTVFRTHKGPALFWQAVNKENMQWNKNAIIKIIP